MAHNGICINFRLGLKCDALSTYQNDASSNLIIMREQHIEFIKKDLKERGEIPTSNITFFGAIYSLKVKKEGDKRAKTVTYSAAKNVLSGYRAISV